MSTSARRRLMRDFKVSFSYRLYGVLASLALGVHLYILMHYC
jgi:hypothetical protein